MRRPGEDYDILIEVTLSYVRRNRGELEGASVVISPRGSTGKAVGCGGVSLTPFRPRALKDQEGRLRASPVTRLPWTIGTRSDHGAIEGVRRTAGTIQKDWATVKSNSLPEGFCIAVVSGHAGLEQRSRLSGQLCPRCQFRESRPGESASTKISELPSRNCGKSSDSRQEIEVEADGGRLLT